MPVAAVQEANNNTQQDTGFGVPAAKPSNLLNDPFALDFEMCNDRLQELPMTTGVMRTARRNAGGSKSAVLDSSGIPPEAAYVL